MIAAAAPPVVVCERCTVRHLSDALRAARPGEIIVVRGVQRGNFVVKTAGVTVAGASDTALDGQGRGTVVTIEAPGVTIEDLAIRNGGRDFVAMDAGIRANGPRTTLRRLQVSGTLFGIYLARADHSTIDANAIDGGRETPIPLRGDAVRIWYSSDVRVTNNRIVDARDNLIWFSPGVLLRGNVVSRGRYGFHTMYANDLTVEGNLVRDCEIGSYVMYARNLRVVRNLFARNRGSTGYGIGLKSVDGAVVAGNAFVSNHVGMYLDNAPSVEGAVDRFDGNLLAYNAIGFAGLPSARGDVLLHNAFVENYRQVAVYGGGTLEHVRWSDGAAGNYWSDYAGFDRNGDGVGDVPYQSRSAYGSLADLDTRLDIFSYSPMAKAIDFAAKALPIFASPPTLVDASPQMSPVSPRGLPAIAPEVSRGSYLALGLAALVVSLGALVPLRPLRRARAATRAREPVREGDAVSAISLRAVGKRYGRVRALGGVDLDVAFGETLALWGPNGSGKTTLLRCMLGVVAFEGRARVAGEPGYVPQQLPLFDMRVSELAAFVAALRQSSPEQAQESLRAAELFDLRSRSVAELSGGQRQRLAIALANVGDPEILLLDEPTVGLDLASRSVILRALRAAKARGKTIVVATHVPEDVLAIADRVAVMGEGRIEAIVTPREFAAAIDLRREAAS